MPDSGYFKGQTCIFKNILCQEGFCSECMIYLEKPQVIAFSIKDKISHLTAALESVLTAEQAHNINAEDKSAHSGS